MCCSRRPARASSRRTVSRTRPTASMSENSWQARSARFCTADSTASNGGEIMMMDNWVAGYGLAHWLLFVVMVAVVLYPLGRILRRLGLSPFWSLLVFIPLVNLVSLWVLAFSDWPAERGRERA